MVNALVGDLMPNLWDSQRGVIVKAWHYGIVVSEFELQSFYYVHF